MHRWKVVLLKLLGWSHHVTRAVVVLVLTFGLILPLCCHRLLYSYYFLKSVYLDQMSDAALQSSYSEGQNALRYWESVVDIKSVEKQLPDHPELLVTVVTARRSEGWKYHYLLQVMQRLDVLQRGCGEAPCAEVLLCDVEHGLLENEDAVIVGKRFRVVKRPKDSEAVNIFEKEKRDYVFCIRKSMELIKPRNLVVLEDDALPRNDFFAIVHNLLNRKFILHSLYVKLYHPERLQRYINPEPYRILEWVGLGVVGASTFMFFLMLFPRLSLPFSVPLFLFLVAYTMVGAELIGRHYLLELRRVSPQLYAVSPATEGCTPAMLFPNNSSHQVAELLDSVSCWKGHAKDTVLFQHASSAHSLEPNAVKHIGAFSSVRSNLLHPKLL